MIRSFSLPDHEIVEGPLDGGMAHVYIARHVVLGRRVAIKVIRPEFVADSGFSARFVREAKIVSRLNHPNVVTLYQVGERQGKPYFVMEYLAGGELKDRIHSSAAVGKTGQVYGANYACKLTLEEVLRIAKEVAVALAVAHENGYVHRDIKPSNIMFRSDNSVVVTDFGIAKATELDKTQADMTVTHGAVVGTPLYMSPEQVDPTHLGITQLDGRADLYSLGAVLYYALTGHPPFTAETPFQLGLKHLAAPIPKLPPYLKHYQPLIQRCMAKRPSDRFASATAFAEEVERLQKIHPRSAIPLNEPLPRFELPWQHDERATARLFHSVSDWFSPMRVAILIFATLILIGLGAWLATRTRTEDLLSVVETQQRAIDSLLNSPTMDFDQAIEKIEYTENLLKIQPNNPASITQLAALQKKLEAGVYDEITNYHFDQAKKHISIINKLYPNWSSKKDIESALQDGQKKWNVAQEKLRQNALRVDLLNKMDAALTNREFEKFSLLIEEAEKINVSSEELLARQTRLEQIKADELAQQEKLKQERIQVLLKQFDEAKQKQDLTALDAILNSLRAAGAAEEQIQLMQIARQTVANDLAEKAKAQLREKEQIRFSQLDAQQASGNLELQFSVWQSLNTPPFQSLPEVKIQALKQRIEQRVTQLIRAELKSGHYDVAEIWSNDAKARGLNLQWAQLERPAAKAPAISTLQDKRTEPVVVPESTSRIEINSTKDNEKNSPAEAKTAARVPEITNPEPAAKPAQKPENPTSGVLNKQASDSADTKEVKPKPRTPSREVQVIGF